MLRRVSSYALLFVMLSGAIIFMVVAGCGGGHGVSLGIVEGWVYADADGKVIISAERVPPELFAAVEDARVEIEGHANLSTTTDANGHYIISCVPPGQQTIIVTIDGEEYSFSVQVVAGERVLGGGHSEGGGGF